MGRTKRQRMKRKMTKGSGSERGEEIRDLLRWMKIEGNGWKSDLKLRNFALGNGSTIRGLMTKTRVGSGEEIIRIPLNLVVDRKTAKESVLKALEAKNLKSPLYGLSTHLLLVMFVLIEFQKGHDSYWWPYLNTLPLSYEMPHFCSQNEFEILPLYVKIPVEVKRREINSRFSELLDILGKEFCTKSDFDWAWFAVNSRVIYFNAAGGLCNEDSIALAPFLDMLNHSPKARVVAGVVDKFQQISNGSGLTYDSYDQVFIHYGHHSNTFLYVEYGFVLADNDDDVVPLSLEDLSSKCQPCKGTLEAIRNARLDESLCVHACGEVSGNVLAVLYVLTNFNGNDNIWKAFEFEDFFLEDPKVKKALGLVIADKLREMQLVKSKCDNVSGRSSSFEVACHLLNLHHEILAKSFSKYCFS